MKPECSLAVCPKKEYLPVPVLRCARGDGPWPYLGHDSSPYAAQTAKNVLNHVLCAELFHLASEFFVPAFALLRLVRSLLLLRAVVAHTVFLLQELGQQVNFHAVLGRIRGMTLVIEDDATNIVKRSFVDAVLQRTAIFKVQQQVFELRVRIRL